MSRYIIFALLAGSSLGQIVTPCETVALTTALPDSTDGIGSININVEIGCVAESLTVAETSGSSPEQPSTPGLSYSSSTSIPQRGTTPTTTYESASRAGSCSDCQVTHTVQVGDQGQFLFDPQQVQANVGDVIVFEFHSINHTLTESSLDKPCEALAGGFDSGFTECNPEDLPGHWISFEINDEDPRWFFCNQSMPTPHCRMGMVFALNPGSLMNQFLANAGPFKAPPPLGFAGPYTANNASFTASPEGADASIASRSRSAPGIASTSSQTSALIPNLLEIPDAPTFTDTGSTTVAPIIDSSAVTPNVSAKTTSGISLITVSPVSRAVLNTASQSEAASLVALSLGLVSVVTLWVTLLM